MRVPKGAGAKADAEATMARIEAILYCKHRESKEKMFRIVPLRSLFLYSKARSTRTGTLTMVSSLEIVI
jgi:hypothetical protein